MWDNRARDDDARRPPQRHRRAAGGAGRGAREADRGSRQGSPGRGRTGGGQSQSLRRSGRDRPSTTADCKADAPALWPAREGVPLSLSTLADQVGGCCAVLAPLLRRVEAHVFAAERLHSDDTTVPVLAKGKTDTGRCWVYVRDDRPFGGPAPPAAMFYYSRDRGGENPQAHLAGYAGIFQADAYGGYTKLYEANRKPGPLVEAACWVHARRPFFVMADIAAAARRKA